MKDNDNVVVINEGIKKRGRGGKYNFPQTVEPEDKDDVRAALSTCLRWYDIGKVKAVTDEEWAQRTDEFFETCFSSGERPTWEKYCLAVGHPRSTVWDYMQSNNAARSDIIKRAKEICATYDAEMVTTGKMRDTPYIFRAKNYYDMKDVQDVVIEPKQSATYDLAEEDIKKFAELPED